MLILEIVLCGISDIFYGKSITFLPIYNYLSFTLFIALLYISYVLTRLKKINSLRWEVGPVLPEPLRTDILSSRENDFYVSYCDILNEYSTSIHLDLAVDLEVCIHQLYLKYVYNVILTLYYYTYIHIYVHVYYYVYTYYSLQRTCLY